MREDRTEVRRLCVATLVAVVLAGCGARAIDDIEEGTSSGPSSTVATSIPGSSSGASSSAGGGTASTSGDGTASTSYGSGADDGFIAPSDLPVLDCDLNHQDCPSGEKCTLYINPDVGEWMGSTCVPVSPNAAGLGDPCTVEDHYGSGYDDCGIGAMCYYVDPDTLEGSCVAFCTGPQPPYNYECEPSATACRPDVFYEGPELLCLPQCDPLLQDCGEDKGCYALTAFGWFCEPNFVGIGMTDDPCDSDTDCAPGFMCSGTGSLYGCQAGGCCTQLCELGQDADCPHYPNEVCNELLADSDVLGFCGMP